MRIVRYQDAVGGTAVDLNGRLTVLSGLSPDARARLVATMRAIPAGTDPGATGSIEVHGVFLDLDAASLELLELHEPIDVVVTAADLPAPEEPPPSGGERVGDGSAAAAERLAAGERALRDARESLETAEAARIGLRGELAGVADRRRELAADIAAARSGVDDAAPASLLRAKENLEALRRRSEAAAIEELAARRGSLEAQLEALIDEADEQRRELKRLASSGTDQVRDALGAAREALDDAPSERAIDLADDFEALERTLTRLEASVANSRSRLSELTARRDAAYDSLVAAERALRTPDLDPALVAELESVHDEIFELDGRAARLSSSRVRRRMNELRERERELLDTLGFDTWSAFVIGMSSSEVEADRKQRYEAAKATYELAEDELARAAAAPMQVADELADRQDERRRLLDRAASLLGEGFDEHDVVELLRGTQRGAAGGGAERVAALDHLRDELIRHGVEQPPDDPAALMEVATRWLGDADSAAAARIREVEATRQHIETEITRLAAELSALPERDAVASPLPDGDRRLAEAQAAVAREEERVRRHRQAQKLLDELRALDAVLATDQARLEAAVGDRDLAVREAERALSSVTESQRRLAAEAGTGDPARGSGPRRGSGPTRLERQVLVDRVEWYVLARLAQQRSVSFVGSVPLVIDDAFVNWSVEELSGVLERLVRMSEVIQIIILTDDVEIHSWARSLGRGVASVVDLAPLS